MKFDMELLRSSSCASRSSWNKNHFLIYDRERSEVMEHNNGVVCVWYWTDFGEAVEDLNASDWRYK